MTTARLSLSFGREVAALLGEVGVEDEELADRLGLGHRLVGVVDGLLDLGAQVGVLAAAATSIGRLAVVRQPGRAASRRRG